MKQEKQSFFKEYNSELRLFLLVVVFMLCIMVGYSLGSIEGEKEGVDLGIKKAEANCANFLCDKMNCSNMNQVNEIQLYCKGLVYGTDFYWRINDKNK